MRAVRRRRCRVRHGHRSAEPLAGTFRFANRAHQRSDGVLLPAIDGVLTAGDRKIVAHLEGRVVRGRQVLAATLVTDANEHRWLHEPVAFAAHWCVLPHGTGPVWCVLPHGARQCRSRRARSFGAAPVWCVSCARSAAMEYVSVNASSVAGIALLRGWTPISVAQVLGDGPEGVSRGHRKCRSASVRQQLAVATRLPPIPC
jgi:hypothetical protein